MYRLLGRLLAAAVYAGAVALVFGQDAAPVADLSQYEMPDATREALIDGSWKTAQAFLAEPTAENAERLESAFVELRRSENLKTLNRVPLEVIYFRLHTPDETEQRIPTEKEWDARLAALDKWRELKPKSTAALIARAWHLKRRAYNARGRAIANLVPARAGEAMRERLQLATESLDKVAEIGDLDPQYYAERINVALGQGDDVQQVKTWLRDGLKLCPTYNLLYINTAIYLLPRWHGKPGDVEALADRLYDYLGGVEGKIAFYYLLRSVQATEKVTLDNSKFSPEKTRESLLAAIQLRNLNDLTLQTLALDYAWSRQDVEFAKAVQSQWGKTLKHRPDPLVKGVLALAEKGRGELGDRHFFTPEQCKPADIEYAPDGRTLLIATNKESFYPIVELDTRELKVAGAFRAETPANQACRIWGEKRDRVLQLQTHEITAQFILSPRDDRGRAVKFEYVRDHKLRFGVARDFSRVAAVGTISGTIYVWDGSNGNKLFELPSNSAPKSVFFTADAKQLAIANELPSGSILKFYDLEKKEFARELPAKLSPEWKYRDAIGCDERGRIVGEVYGRGKRTWAYIDPESLAVEPIYAHSFGHLPLRQLSPDGKYLILVSQSPPPKAEQRLIVVRLADGKEALNRELANANLTCATVSPDGKTVACADGAGVIRFYDLAAE